MSNSIKVRHKLAFLHEGGTKFWELVCVEGLGGRSALIRRWGPISELRARASQKIEYFGTQLQADAGRSKLVQSKSRGGYRPSSQPDFGLWRARDGERLILDDLVHHVGKKDGLELFNFLNELEAVVSYEPAPPPKKPAAKQDAIDRKAAYGDAWGAW